MKTILNVLSIVLLGSAVIVVYLVMGFYNDTVDLENRLRVAPALKNRWPKKEPEPGEEKEQLQPSNAAQPELNEKASSTDL